VATISSTRRTTTICQPSADTFALHRDLKSRMSLLGYAERTWPMNADDTSDAQGAMFSDVPIASAHVDVIKRFGKIALMIVLVAVVLAGIASLRSANDGDAAAVEPQIHSKGNVS